MKEVLHFAHGNGFPSPCYKQLLQGLEARFDCYYIDKIGHAPAFPITDNWHFLVEEVLHSIRQQTVKPVIAVGHSLGGVLSLLAAIEQPDLFKAVILLDSPVLGRLKSNLLRLFKAIGFIDKITPAHRTRGRRVHWMSKEDAVAYLKTRTLFKSFSDACLDDYIEYGMQKSENGYVLRFDRQVEYQIYRTIPHQLHASKGRLSIPAGLIYGNKSHVIHSLDLRNMQKNYGILTVETKGTHMFPMEYPQTTAELIGQLVDTMLG